jgi:ABC-type lipoprotein release transport system permease subunit
MMIIIKLAIRTILRRKSRMLAIGVLVFLGTLLLVFGETFALSAAIASKQSIIDNFTGDFIIYSGRSQEKPSPFSFTSPLPVIQNIEEVRNMLQDTPEVDVFVPYAQNYAIISVTRSGKAIEIPFIFYAVEPDNYNRAFNITDMAAGSFFGLDKTSSVPEQGIVISLAQNERYQKFYDVTLTVGEELTLLGLTPGGSINAVKTRLLGIFEPVYYKNVFDYVNFTDMTTYSELYNFTGVKEDSLPDELTDVFSSTNEDDIFALAAEGEFTSLDFSALESQALSGYTMIAVKLKDHNLVEEVRARFDNSALNIKTAPWDEASSFFAQIAEYLQTIIYAVVTLIFLIVTFIIMNTLIINIVERTAEIGTMRALGGEKGFIRNLFLTETLILNGVFALAGILVSLLLILSFGAQGIPLPDIVSQYLVGGGNLPLLLSLSPFTKALLIIVLVSVLATLYPIRVATKILPLKAMN